MKYALFEFTTEKSCEVGDPTTFDNRNWEMDKEVMVVIVSFQKCQEIL